MKLYALKRPFKGYEKGTRFYLVAYSEFIGVKEFVLRTENLSERIAIGERELEQHFTFIKEVY